MRKDRRVKGLTRLATGLLATTLILYGGISLFTADQLTRPTNHPLQVEPRRLGDDVQPWTAVAADGITLRGWYLPTENHRRLIVLVHGMWSSWLEMGALGRDLHKDGFDVLLFDLRGHGQSDPSRLTMGRRERIDIRTVMTWAKQKGFSSDRVGWLGYSMGASTLLMEAAQNPEIRVAVMDSPFGDLPAVLDKQLNRHSHLPSWFNPGILGAARWVLGVRTDDLVPVRFARAWGNRPLLLIHGESDSIVPVHQSYQLAHAAGASCLTMTLPGVEHVQGYRSNPGAYLSLIETFFRDHLSP